VDSRARNISSASRQRKDAIICEIATENSEQADPKEGEEQDERASEHTSSDATTADDDDGAGGESVKITQQ
jgi:hypothetical protein